jgi:hypothetical protein
MENGESPRVGLTASYGCGSSSSLFRATNRGYRSHITSSSGKHRYLTAYKGIPSIAAVVQNHPDLQDRSILDFPQDIAHSLVGQKKKIFLGVDYHSGAVHT